MPRDDLHGRIDAALASYRVVVIEGLPRAGRTSLTGNWAATRDDVRMATAADANEAQVVVHDHLGIDAAANLIHIVRTPEWQANGQRLIIVPDDLSTVKLLKDRLVGQARCLQLEPVSLEEARIEALAVTPVGPVASDAAPSETPVDVFLLDQNTHWLRGGLPESLFAANDQDSFEWRTDLLAGLLGRDYGAFGITHAARLPDFAREIAAHHGGQFNESIHHRLRRQELGSAIYVLEEIGLVRRLTNVARGLGFPDARDKLYVRDSGFLHALLGISDIEQLRRSTAVGESFEGYVIETLVRVAGDAARPGFFRAVTDPGRGEDEIDLVLDFAPGHLAKLAIEVKTGERRRARGGFGRACGVIGATDRFIVHSGDVSSDEPGVPRLSLAEAAARVAAARR